ncbi:glycosyltransferase [Chitinophaga sp. MM2321]|uniref:glycosyltransferase n=1 Tax=Chitinophaga sp. MM2321 TaxID=3137178 RepID=UPI0032D59B66
MNITHVITGLGRGGAEKFLYNISSAFNNLGYPQKVIVLNNEQLDLMPLFKDTNIEVEVLNVTRNPYSLVLKAYYFSRSLKNTTYNILHAHMFHALVFACLTKLFLPQTRIVFTSHSFNIGSKLRERFTFLLRPFRDMDILFSRKMHRRFYKRNEYSIIPNGIPTRNYCLDIAKGQDYIFISVARLEKVKNQKVIIDAAAKLVKDGLKFKIWLVGEGEMKDYLRQYTSSLNLDEVVLFKGFSEDIPRLLNKSNCFLLPSLWEGLPLSLLEAGASGLPIICTPVGSIPEFFSREQVEYADIYNLYPAMKKVLLDQEGYVRKGEQLKKYIIENFDIQITVQQHLAVYKKLIKQ